MTSVRFAVYLSAFLAHRCIGEASSSSLYGSPPSYQAHHANAASYTQGDYSASNAYAKAAETHAANSPGAATRSLKKERGQNIVVITGGGAPSYNALPQQYYSGGFSLPTPGIQLTHQRVPSTRVASLETRSSPISIAERPVLIAPNSQPVCDTHTCGPTITSGPAVVVEREDVTRIVREKSCPQGMELSRDNGMCVGLDICPVTYTCPPSTTEGPDGRCTAVHMPLSDCPPGYTPEGDRCISVTVTAAELVCEDPRFTLDRQSNLCVLHIDVPPRCPAGYALDGAECVQQCLSEPVCPLGWSLSPATQDCVRTVTEPAVSVCPEGARSEAGADRCVVVRQDPPRCPPRTVYDGNMRSCIQSVPKVAVDCPYGHTRVGAHCEMVNRRAAEYSCPPDWELGPDMVCSQVVEQPPTCPTGFVMSATHVGLCEKCVKEQPVCPPGSRTVGVGRCEVERERPSTECCAPGFKLEQGQCHRVEILAPTLTCENECYSVTETPIAYACPSDAEFVDHPDRPRCVRKVVTAGNNCPPVQPSPVRCMEELDGSAPHSLKGNVCIPVVPPLPVQPACSGPVESTESLPAEPYCPSGGVVEGRRCVSREPIVPMRVCKVGELNPATGQCEREIFLPVKSECSAGSIRRGNKCYSVEQVAPEVKCPSGSQLSDTGVCVTLREPIQPPSKVSRLQAIPSCKIGVLSGRECLESVRQPVELVCPPHAVLSENGNDCIVTADLIVPAPVEKPVRASLVCPPNSTLNGRVCVSSEHMPADRVCPSGAVQRGDVCLRAVPAIISAPRVQSAAAQPICAKGVVRGSNCEVHLESPPMLSCPAGFLLEESKCVRELAKTPLCPEGTILRGSGCVRPVTVPPTIRIVQGCVNEVLRECDSCPSQVKVECHNSF